MKAHTCMVSKTTVSEDYSKTEKSYFVGTLTPNNFYKETAR